MFFEKITKEHKWALPEIIIFSEFVFIRFAATKCNFEGFEGFFLIVGLLWFRMTENWHALSSG
jgi:hypothetical protein